MITFSGLPSALHGILPGALAIPSGAACYANAILLAVLWAAFRASPTASSPFGGLAAMHQLVQARSSLDRRPSRNANTMCMSSCSTAAQDKAYQPSGAVANETP